jgi:oligopeptide/dipeptide ABC transporter ATP-binding protein
MDETGNNKQVLRIEDLFTSFYTDQGVAHAVDGVNLAIRQGETLALVGESGCGKTALALSILRLIPSPPGRIDSGRVLFLGEDLLEKSERDLRRIRGNRISMIFQEPMTALNPVLRVGEQIAEVGRLHLGMNRAQARDMAVDMLRKVNMPDAGRRASSYPYQLSGGMQQRVMIAMALACGPELLLADEPTTALDVTVQAQILGLLEQFQEKQRMAILLITHDLSLVAETADRVCVMYASRIVEEAETTALLAEPRHPYTRGLIRSAPAMEGDEDRLREIPGQVPSPLAFPAGCRFYDRCERRKDRCRDEAPLLEEIEPSRWAACHYPWPARTGDC